MKKVKIMVIIGVCLNCLGEIRCAMMSHNRKLDLWLFCFRVKINR